MFNLGNFKATNHTYNQKPLVYTMPQSTCNQYTPIHLPFGLEINIIPIITFIIHPLIQYIIYHEIHFNLTVYSLNEKQNKQICRKFTTVQILSHNWNHAKFIITLQTIHMIHGAQLTIKSSQLLLRQL